MTLKMLKKSKDGYLKSYVIGRNHYCYVYLNLLQDTDIEREFDIRMYRGFAVFSSSRYSNSTNS